MSFFVYILASRRNGTLYIGMTDNLAAGFGCITAALSPASQRNTPSKYSSGMNSTNLARVPSNVNAR